MNIYIPHPSMKPVLHNSRVKCWDAYGVPLKREKKGQDQPVKVTVGLSYVTRTFFEQGSLVVILRIAKFVATHDLHFFLFLRCRIRVLFR